MTVYRLYEVNMRRLLKEIALLNNFQETVSTAPSVDRTKFQKKFAPLLRSLYSEYNVVDIQNVALDGFNLKMDILIKRRGRLGTEPALIKRSKINVYIGNYPFGLPQLTVDSMIWSPCIKVKYQALFGIVDPICTCCSSVLCGANWTPFNNIVDIITEYARFYRDYFTRIQDRSSSNYVCDIIFGFYLPIDTFL